MMDIRRSVCTSRHARGFVACRQQRLFGLFNAALPFDAVTARHSGSVQHSIGRSAVHSSRIRQLRAVPPNPNDLIAGINQPPKMSSQVLRAIQVSKDEAGRQGCMFVEANHILLGILGLGEGSSALHALRDLGLEQRSVRSALDKQLAIPVLSQLRASDVEVGSVARNIISDATRHAQGCSCVSTSHVLQVLLQHPKCSLQSLLDAQGKTAEQAAERIAAASSSVVEVVAGQPLVPKVEEQVAGLQREYRRMQQQQEMGAGSAAFSSEGARQASSQQTDDDIYE